MRIDAPWHPVTDQQSIALVAELAREIVPTHQLAGATVRAIAARQDMDDVLFEVYNRSDKFAIVHLTYSHETDPRWPDTLLLADETAVQMALDIDIADFQS